jgi:CheY-like chemotaxis protein
VLLFAISCGILLVEPKESGRMGMQRLLIADPTGIFSTAIKKQLKNEFLIESSVDGDRTLKLLRNFDPDILLIDLQLPGVDGFTVLRTLRGCGMTTSVIARTSLTDAHILSELESLQVSMALLTTSRLSSVLNSIRSLSRHLRDTGDVEWDAENETDRILLDLGFRVVTARYYTMRAAVLYMYNNPGCYLTKCLYPDIAKQFDGTKLSVEKTIRDCIKYAWENGDPQIWNMYFPQNEMPSNEVFLGRISAALLQKERHKKPYEPCELLA